MKVYGLDISDKGLTNFDLWQYAEKLDIENFRGLYSGNKCLYHEVNQYITYICSFEGRKYNTR